MNRSAVITATRVVGIIPYLALPALGTALWVERLFDFITGDGAAGLSSQINSAPVINAPLPLSRLATMAQRLWSEC